MDNTANRIKKALSKRGLKQADLVEMTGIGKSSISTYISGDYEPKQKNLYKIAKALDVNAHWLMGYDVPMEERETSNSLKSQSLFSPDTQEVIKAYEQADLQHKNLARVALGLKCLDTEAGLDTETDLDASLKTS